VGEGGTKANTVVFPLFFQNKDSNPNHPATSLWTQLYLVASRWVARIWTTDLQRKEEDVVLSLVCSKEKEKSRHNSSSKEFRKMSHVRKTTFILFFSFSARRKNSTGDFEKKRREEGTKPALSRGIQG
jgi:hypothetical protein